MGKSCRIIQSSSFVSWPACDVFCLCCTFFCFVLLLVFLAMCWIIIYVFSWFKICHLHNFPHQQQQSTVTFLKPHFHILFFIPSLSIWCFIKSTTRIYPSVICFTGTKASCVNTWLGSFKSRGCVPSVATQKVARTHNTVGIRQKACIPHSCVEFSNGLNWVVILPDNGALNGDFLR